MQIYNAVAKHCRDSCYIATLLRDKKRRLTLSINKEPSLNIYSSKDSKLKLNYCKDSSNLTKKGINRGVETFFLSQKNFVVECW